MTLNNDENTNTQLTTLSQDQINELNQLASDLGSSSLSGDYLPTFGANYYDEIEIDGKKYEIKPGTLTIRGIDNSPYSRVSNVRVLSQHFQYRKFDKVEDKVVNKSVFFTDFREEAIDEQGTLRAGKPPSKVLKADAELAKQYENTNVFRVLHLLVDIEGKDALGNDQVLTNQLAVWSGKGANFMPFDDEYNKKRPKNSQVWDYNMKVTVSKEKNGTTTYWVLHFEPDFSNRLTVDSKVFDTLKEINNRVKDQNKEISKKYELALSRGRDNTEASNIMKTVNENSTSLDNDFDDDLPF